MINLPSRCLQWQTKCPSLVRYRTFCKGQFKNFIQFFIASLMIISMSMISTIYCLRLHYTLGQNEIPRFMRAIFPFAHKYLWLAPPPSRPVHELSECQKVVPIKTLFTEKTIYAELVEKVGFFITITGDD